MTRHETLMGLAVPTKADAVPQVPRRAYGRGRKDERAAMTPRMAERIFGLAGAVALAVAFYGLFVAHE